MTLYLDGQPVPGYDLRVTAQGQIARGDLSGETSGTGAAHQGWKAWVLGVSCKVRFADALDLLALRLLFHTQDEQTQAPHLWRINETTAAALGIFQARCADFFQVDPDEKGRFWHVKFTLIEERSIPERTDERTEASPAAQPGAPAGTSDTDAQAAAQLGNIADQAAVDGWAVRLSKKAEELASKFGFLQTS